MMAEKGLPTYALRSTFLDECEKFYGSLDGDSKSTLSNDRLCSVALGRMSMLLEPDEIKRLSKATRRTDRLGEESIFAMVARSAIALRKLGLGIVDREEAIQKNSRLSNAKAKIKQLEAELASANERIHRMRVGA